jgi:hypothetical protein
MKRRNGRGAPLNPPQQGRAERMKDLFFRLVFSCASSAPAIRLESPLI